MAGSDRWSVPAGGSDGFVAGLDPGTPWPQQTASDGSCRWRARFARRVQIDFGDLLFPLAERRGPSGRPDGNPYNVGRILAKDPEAPRKPIRRCRGP